MSRRSGSRRNRAIEPNQAELEFIESFALRHVTAGLRVISFVPPVPRAQRAVRGTAKGEQRGHYRKPEQTEPISGIKRRLADMGRRAANPKFITWSPKLSKDYPVVKFENVMIIAERLLEMPEGWLVEFIARALSDPAIGRDWKAGEGFKLPKPDRRQRESQGVYLPFREAPMEARAKFKSDILPIKYAEHRCGRCGGGEVTEDGSPGRMFKLIRKRNRSKKIVVKPDAYCEDCRYWQRRGE